MPSRKRAASRLRSVPGGPTATASRRPSVLPTKGQAGDIPDARLGRLLLPLRVFLGVTFIYAGLVKLADPTFLDPGAPGSLVEQLHAFARDSPLSPLITAIAIPLAAPIGLSIALGELAVGLGALFGLAARAAAWAGFAISVLFFLTASWATHPYFYGPDLPYAAGWLTLALVGDGGLYVLRGRTFGRPGGGGTSAAEDWSPGRRAFLETLTLGIAAIALGGVGLARPSWLRDLLGAASGGAPGVASVPGGSIGATATPAQSAGSPVQTAVPAATSPPVPTNRASAGIAPPPAGLVTIGTVQTVAAAGSATFVVPASGDPGVLVKLANGSIVAFDAVCTHAGCPVDYVPQDKLLECPCHGAVFDPAHGGAVLAGPAFEPLLALPITIDRSTGQIRISSSG